MALLAAAGLYLGSAGMAPAQAADLGGDCCADLEERVAELEATTARKGNRRVSLTISGQVNTAVMFWDDGVDSDVYVVDNAVSRSGFNLTGSAKINPNLSAGFEIIVGLQAGARSHNVSATDDDGGADDGVIAMERANWYLAHKQLGTLRVGRINTASSGVSTVDLGGAGVIANSNINLWQRSFRLTDGDVEIDNSAATWNNLVGGTPMGIAGLSRANAVSYTTATFAGFSASAAWGENDLWDAALRYAGEFGGFRLAAAVGYANNVGGTDEVSAEFTDGPQPGIWKGSASVLHVASGLYLTGAYVNRDNDEENAIGPGDRPDSTLWYLQGGVSKNWTGLGKTVLYGEYAQADDGATGTFFTQEDANGDIEVIDFITASEVSMWGIGIVQHVDAAAMELYLSYRQYSGEVDSFDTGLGDIDGDTDLNDFSVVMGGARIRF